MDLVEEGVAERGVPREEVNAYAKQMGAKHFETSAKTGAGIELLFQTIAEQYIKSAASSANADGGGASRARVTPQEQRPQGGGGGGGDNCSC